MSGISAGSSLDDDWDWSHTGRSRNSWDADLSVFRAVLPKVNRRANFCSYPTLSLRNFIGYGGFFADFHPFCIPLFCRIQCLDHAAAGFSATTHAQPMDDPGIQLFGHRTACRTKTAATANLQTGLDEAEEILKKGLDKLVYQFRDTDFYKEYQSARKSINTGVRYETPDETKPTDPANPTTKPKFSNRCYYLRNRLFSVCYKTPCTTATLKPGLPRFPSWSIHKKSRNFAGNMPSNVWHFLVLYCARIFPPPATSTCWWNIFPIGTPASCFFGNKMNCRPVSSEPSICILPLP